MKRIRHGNVELLLVDGFVAAIRGLGPWLGYVAYPYRGYSVSCELSEWVETPMGPKPLEDEEVLGFASEAQEALCELWDELLEIAEAACRSERGVKIPLLTPYVMGAQNARQTYL